jgi:hypothetical protein
MNPRRIRPSLPETVRPVSGRSYLTRPEWLLASNHHTYRLGVLDDLVLCQSFGRTTEEDVHAYCAAVEPILARSPGWKKAVQGFLSKLALAAHAMEGDREVFLKEGMDDYLSRPIRLQELRAKLEAWLGGSHSRGKS